MDVVKKVNALKARKNLGQLLEEVYYKGKQYVIERPVRPMAAVVPIWQLEEWQKRGEWFFGMVEELWQENKGVKPEVIEREVAEAVQRSGRRPLARGYDPGRPRRQRLHERRPQPKGHSGTDPHRLACRVLNPLRLFCRLLPAGFLRRGQDP